MDPILTWPAVLDHWELWHDEPPVAGNDRGDFYQIQPSFSQAQPLFLKLHQPAGHSVVDRIPPGRLAVK